MMLVGYWYNRGTVYYFNGNTWFQPAYGANGVFDTIVPAP